MKLAISGANSSIGKSLISSLSNVDIELFLIIRNDDYQLLEMVKNFNVKIIYLSMEEYIKLEELLPDKLDAFIHLAWSGTRGVSRENYDLQHQNYLNSIILYDILIEKKCEAFITVGSQSEYGLKFGLITEETKLDPTTQYGLFKTKFSNYIFNHAHKIRNVWFRLFSAYGIYDYERTLIMSLLKSINNGDKFFRISNGDSFWNYINYYDVAKIITLCIDLYSIDGIFNLASNDTRKLIDYMNEIIKITNSKIKLINETELENKHNNISIMPSIKKLSNALINFEFTCFNYGIINILKNKEDKYEKL